VFRVQVVHGKSNINDASRRLWGNEEDESGGGSRPLHAITKKVLPLRIE
jgi:hypothetical protein